MEFLTPAAFAGTLLAIPVLLLYMLRLRRRELPISSIYLWQQVLQDQEVNTPWQRLRRNLLLLLQLLILALLVLALARPVMTFPAVSASQVTILLDASASMNATDMDGDTRFEAAQREAIDIVDTLSEGDRVTIIRVGSLPEILVTSSTDRTQARAAIRGAWPGAAPADWEGALNLAAASGASADDFTIVVISDGGLPENSGLPGFEGQLRYIPVGQAGDNVAITALATRALPGQPPELYARVTNYGSTEARVVFTLYVDDVRFASENQTIPPDSSLPVISSALPAGFTTLRATLTQSVNALAPDHMALDDVAYAVAGSTQTRRILLVTQGSVFLEQVLRSLSGLDVVRTGGETGLPPDYDLYLFDGIMPDVLPDGDVMFINPPESLPDFFTLGETSTTTAGATIDQDDTRMAFVDVSALNVLRFREVSGVEWADELLWVDGGPLLLAGERAGRQMAIMPFDLRESDLPLQIAWPVLMANLMEWFTPSAAITVRDSLRVGEPLVIRPPFEVDRVRVSLPGGGSETLAVERETVVFAGTEQPGIYRLELLAGNRVVSDQPFAVNLFSPLESRIAPVAPGDLVLEGVSLAEDEESDALGQRDLWPLVALAALLILMGEWLVYRRRMQAPAIPVRRRPAGVPS